MWEGGGGGSGGGGEGGFKIKWFCFKTQTKKEENHKKKKLMYSIEKQVFRRFKLKNDA